MQTRLHFLIAIESALADGFNNLALAWLTLHDDAHPSTPLRPAFDRMLLGQLNASRQLQEIA